MKLLVALVVVGCGHAPDPQPPRLPVAACTPAPAPIPDYTHLAGVPVARIAVRGTGFDTATATKLLATKPGAPLDPDTLRADIRRVWDLGIASQVAVTAEPSPAGYAIELTVEGPLRVSRVEIAGATRTQLATLATLEGTLHDQARLARLTLGSQQYLRDHGYLRAEITSVAHVECDGVVVHVDATLRRRYTLSRIDVTGSQLANVMLGFERELGTLDRIGAPYREDAFAFDLDQLVQRHREQGWLDATAKPPTSTIDDATGHVSVQAAIVPGVRYKVKLAIDGGTPAQRKVADEVYRPLHDHWYDATDLETARDALASRFAREQVRARTNGEADHGVYRLTVIIKAAP